MTVGCYLLGGVATDRESLLEKLLGGFHIAFLAQARINQVAISINGSIKIVPFSLDPHVGFVDIPGFSCLSMSFFSQLICEQRGESRFPIPHRFMTERPPTLQKHLCEIAQTQFVAQPPNHDKENM